MTSDESMCTEAPITSPTVVPEKYTFEECAKVQQHECREGTFVPQQDLAPLLDSLCEIQCRFLYGSQKNHDYLDSHPEFQFCEKWQNLGFSHYRIHHQQTTR